jgi:hypothetical protein
VYRPGFSGDATRGGGRNGWNGDRHRDRRPPHARNRPRARRDAPERSQRAIVAGHRSSAAPRLSGAVSRRSDTPDTSVRESGAHRVLRADALDTRRDRHSTESNVQGRGPRGGCLGAACNSCSRKCSGKSCSPLRPRTVQCRVPHFPDPPLLHPSAVLNRFASLHSRTYGASCSTDARRTAPVGDATSPPVPASVTRFIRPAPRRKSRAALSR